MSPLHNLESFMSFILTLTLHPRASTVYWGPGYLDVTATIAGLIGSHAVD